MRPPSKVICIALFIVSCKRNEANIDGYFYNDSSSAIYFFKDSLLTVYDMIHLKEEHHQIIQLSEKLVIDKKAYDYNNYEDSLIYFIQNKERISLKKFNLNLNIDTSFVEKYTWCLEVERKKEEKNEIYMQQQFLNIDFKDGSDFFYLNEDKDTIFGHDYEYMGKTFQKLHLFSYYYTTFILNDQNSDYINIVSFDGWEKSGSYRLKKIKKISTPLAPPMFWRWDIEVE
ncbi:MAG: hypothetical protein IT220_03585 [Flavobacteriaceae bacterium]|nr:hypothetical protein [Flavobacteriaceae bacterium]